MKQKFTSSTSKILVSDISCLWWRLWYVVQPAVSLTDVKSPDMRVLVSYFLPDGAHLETQMALHMCFVWGDKRA